ncbi:hypothetical protein RUM44_001040 [Polyplax serrata]|uniref:non-specific serine/threonine protein kinase n=1 Tax=Polyplax serrata TaxID=468196 RepID=A0ABR1B7K4_POLSC
MSSGNSLAEELEALKSIFEDDFKCDESNVTITLFPLQEREKKEIFVQVDLCIECPPTYPKKEPHLSIKNVKGLSDKQVEVLYYNLNEMIKTLKGGVMIYNLAYYVQEFLSENNKPGKKSCYEEMIIRKEQQRQKEYQSEIYKKTKLIKDIEAKQKEIKKLNENDDSSNEESDETEKFEKLSLGDDKIRLNNKVQKEAVCEHRSCRYIQFNNKILRGRCIEHNSNAVIYCAIDSTTGDQLLLQEWTLRSVEDDIRVEQKLAEIQKNFDHLKKLCHENLISYIDFKWSFDKEEYTVHLLQEYVTSFNLNVLLEKNVDLDINFIRYILGGILKGLEHLHSHGIVHGCLSGCHVHINKKGTVKLSGYGIKKVMDDLHNSCHSKIFEGSDSKIMSNKNDILNVGLLLLRIMKFTFVEGKEILVPDFQPPELKEFVEKCLIENEEGRWTAKKLLSHKFLHVKAMQQSIQKTRYSNIETHLTTKELADKTLEVIFKGNDNINSRLSKEFKILNFVGNGSFGKVLKVKNKLDGNIYAIKAIRLSMNNKQMDKKMVREVKLLSKLNHENVVRYYTSWIETDSTALGGSSDTELDVIDGTNVGKLKTNANSQNENDEEEEEYDEEGSESESSDEVDAVHYDSQEKCEQSSYIQFLKDSGNDKKDADSKWGVSEKNETDFKVQPNRTMYIQMEFCEKSTLRIAINETVSGKLCEDERRLWRLFREIVEGLAYVHGQGMIHRDLKPENIFLDSSDHVKIGDFGLATISVVSKCFWLKAEVSCGGGDNNASSQNIYDDYHTGKVGTSLYVAPELDKTFGKSFYNKKVDIYSLGIIFFEMCNGRFGTDMERIETILNLRKFEIILPQSWEEKLPKQKNLIKKLLNHDPKSRPSSQELLEGNYLPPGEFEYEHWQDIVRHTLANPTSKAYKYLIQSCFDQEVRVEEDITYQFENIRSEKQYFLLDLVKERMESILRKHGAIYFSTPLLLPQSKDQKSIEPKVKLITHSGSIVNLPYDLRILFARYAAVKGFTRLRRYVVEKIFKEKKVHGLHPKEQYECAFDLVTPACYVENAELEVLSVIQEVINGFKSLKNRNCIIRLNHAHLLKAILIHFNSEKWYSDVFKILSSAKDNKYFKSKLGTLLQALGFQSATPLINLFLKEDSVEAIKKDLFSLINKRGPTLDKLNVAFQKLQSIIHGAERLDIKVPIKIAPGVVCNSEQCSDIMFDVIYSVKQKGRKEGSVTLISGCRFDGLLTSFRRLFELADSHTENNNPSAVGLTVHLDKVVAVLKEDNILSEYVIVYSFGYNSFSRLNESIVKKLWSAGIKCYIEQNMETLEELTDYCRENKIIHIITLKEEESNFVNILTWDNDKNHYVERKILVRDIIDYILKFGSDSDSISLPVFSRQCSESQGKYSSNEVQTGSPTVNIHFLSDEKFTSTQRRRYENQIRMQISSIVCRFSPRSKLEILGVFLDEQTIKEIVINFNPYESCNTNYELIFDRYSEKKYILKVYTKIKSLLTNTTNTVVVLFSLSEDKYRLLLGPA